MKRKTPVLFKNRHRATCPDCIERNAVNLVGQPVFRGGAKLTYGCETCGGTGRVTYVNVVGSWPVDLLWIQRKVKT